MGEEVMRCPALIQGECEDDPCKHCGMDAFYRGAQWTEDQIKAMLRPVVYVPNLIFPPQQPDPGDNLFIGRGESPPQHNVARYWCERAQRAEQALATAVAKETPNMWALYLAEKRRVAALEETIARLKGELAEEMTSHTSDVLYYDRMVDLLEAKLAALTVDPTPAALPPAPTRPDGTQAPEPKPWSPPKSGGDPRRIGN